MTAGGNSLGEGTDGDDRQGCHHHDDQQQDHCLTAVSPASFR
jgi:hypothetical protein